MSVNGYLSLVVHKEQKARKVEVKFKAWEWVMYGECPEGMVSARRDEEMAEEMVSWRKWDSDLSSGRGWPCPD